MSDGVRAADKLSVALLGMGWSPDQPGGLNRCFGDLLRAVEVEGLCVSAVAVGPAATPPGELRVAGDRDDPLNSRLRQYASATRAAARNADVVDAHFALYALLPKLLGWLGDAALVVHFQGPWADESRSAGEGRAKAWAKRLVERTVYRDARGAVVLSHAFKRLLVERYRVSPWIVRAIPPGVDLDRFSPGDRAAARAEVRVPNGRPMVLCVRRLVPRMGVDVLLEGWSELVQQRPEALLAIVGDGPARDSLQALAEDLEISGSVRFAGRVSDEEQLAWYRAADVSVVPTTALEGFGLVVLESLACGTPVVATDVGGLPEALGGLDRSLIVPSQDAEALARRLVDGLGGHEPFPAANACRRYAETFSWARAAKAHREVYEAALAPPTARKLRVLYLDHCAQLSGGELALLRLLKASPDVDAHVILAEEGPLVGRLLEAGISVEVMPLARGARLLRRDGVRPGLASARSLLPTAFYALRLAARVRRLRPDLVHTNSLKAALYGGVAGRLARTPVVWHVRDRIADDYLPQPAVRLVRALAQRLPNAVIANSKTTLATLGELNGRSRVIASPVEMAHRAPRAAGANGGIRFGVVGRLAPWKGQDVFVAAFARAFPNGPERAALVGAPLFGEEDYEAELRRQAADLGLNGRLEFRGFRDDVQGELGRLDVLVHSSVTPEPFGQVVVEAMAAGVPVVAADAGGPAELIEDGVDGLLYEPGNVEALTATLRRIALDPELRLRLTNAGRRRAEEFVPERVAAEVIDVYRAVAGTTIEAGVG